MQDVDSRAIVGRLLQAMARADLDEIDRIVAEDYIDRDPPIGFGAGRGELKRQAQHLVGATMTTLRSNWVVEDNTVSYDAAAYAGPGHEAYAEGTPIAVGHHEYTLRDGRVIRHAGPVTYLVPTVVVDKWQYAALDMRHFSDRWSMRPLDDGPAVSTIEQIVDSMGRMGLEGWELVGVLPLYSHSEAYAPRQDWIWLKRRSGQALVLADTWNPEPRVAATAPTEAPEGNSASEGDVQPDQPE
jgi:hypothetical protein